MNEKFFKIFRWTFDEMSIAERFVYAYIYFYAVDYKQTSGYCTATQERMAQELGIGLRTVKRNIATLSAGGWIHVEKSMQYGKSDSEKKVCFPKCRYKINKEKAQTQAEIWRAQELEREQQNGRKRNMPEFLPVYECMLLQFKASVQCLLIANLYQLQAYAQHMDEVSRGSDNPTESAKYINFVEGISYGQKELAIMCGCTLTSVLNALNGRNYKDEQGRKGHIPGLIEREYIRTDFSTLYWSKTKKSYALNYDIFPVKKSNKAQNQGNIKQKNADNSKNGTMLCEKPVETALKKVENFQPKNANSKNGTMLPDSNSKNGTMLPDSNSKNGTMLPDSNSKNGTLLITSIPDYIENKNTVSVHDCSPETGHRETENAKSKIKIQILETASAESGTENGKPEQDASAESNESESRDKAVQDEQGVHHMSNETSPQAEPEPEPKSNEARANQEQAKDSEPDANESNETTAQQKAIAQEHAEQLAKQIRLARSWGGDVRKTQEKRFQYFELSPAEIDELITSTPIEQIAPMLLKRIGIEAQ